MQSTGFMFIRVRFEWNGLESNEKPRSSDFAPKTSGKKNETPPYSASLSFTAFAIRLIETKSNCDDLRCQSILLRINSIPAFASLHRISRAYLVWCSACPPYQEDLFSSELFTQFHFRNVCVWPNQCTVCFQFNAPYRNGWAGIDIGWMSASVSVRRVLYLPSRTVGDFRPPFNTTQVMLPHFDYKCFGLWNYKECIVFDWSLWPPKYPTESATSRVLRDTSSSSIISSAYLHISKCVK